MRESKCSYCEGSGFLTAICKKTAQSYAFRCDNCEAWLQFTEFKGQSIKISSSIMMWNHTLHDQFILEPLTGPGVGKMHKAKRGILEGIKGNGE